MGKFNKALKVLGYAGLFVIAGATAVSAGPIAAIGAAAWGWITTTAVGAFVGNMVASMAISKVASVLAKKKASKLQTSGGITTDVTMTGGSNPQRMVLGEYATAGSMIAPDYTFDYGIGSDLKYLTRIIAISDYPVDGLKSVIIDGVEYPITSTTHNHFGNKIGGALDGYAWIKFHDGNQTTADERFVEVLGTYPKRPWTSQHILKGVSYAFVTFKFEQKLFQGIPNVKFVLRGAKLYDPRLDSSVGGVGNQRWDDKSTWTFTTNPVVQVYNLFRGISLADGSIYGVGATASELPLSSWFTAMNVCDARPSGSASDDMKRYQSGFEFSFDSEPLDVIEEILASCGGEIAETGSGYHITVGPPSLPIISINDDHVLLSEPRDAEQFRGVASMYNAVHSSYPSPADLWATKDAAPIYNAAYESQDDNRRLVSELKLSTVPYPKQARRLMREYLADGRRELVWNLVLGPQFLGLKPLDVISWTSALNGYANKRFEIQSVTVDVLTLNVHLTVRERDTADYVYNPVSDAVLPSVPDPSVVKPVIVGLQGLAATAYQIFNPSGKPSAVGIRVSWDADSAYSQIAFEVRDTAGVLVENGSVSNTSSGQVNITGGLQPETAYQVRAMAVVEGRDTQWSSLIDVTTLSIAPIESLLSDEVRESLDTLNEWIDSDLPSTVDDLVLDMNVIHTDFDALANTVNSLSSSVTVLGSSVGVLTGQVQSFANAISGLQTLTSNIDGRVTSQGTSIQQLTSNVTSLRNNANAQSNLISGLTSRVTATENGIEALTSDVTSLSSNLSSMSNTVSVQGSGLSALEVLTANINGRVTSHQAQLTSLSGNVSSLSNTVSGQGTAISQLTSNVTAIRANVTSLQTSVTQLSSNVTSLRGNVNAHSSAITSLTTRTSAVEGDVSSLSSTMTSLSASVGQATGSGQFRIDVQANSAGVASLIGLKAVANSGEPNNAREAGLFLEARTDGTSQVIVRANRFAVSTGSSRSTPFIIDNGNVYLSNAHIKADSLTLPLFANGVLQTALYPVRVDIFMQSVANWQPPMEGLAAAYVIGGGGGGGAVYQGYYNNQAAQGYRPMFAGGGGSGGFGWNFIPNLRFGQRFNIFVGAGGSGGSVSGGTQEGWGWDGGASHIYNVSAGGWSESQIINVWAAGGQTGWVGRRDSQPAANGWSPPTQSGHATGGRWNSPSYGNTHDMNLHIGAGGSSADFGLGVERWGNPFGEGQQGGMREAWPAIFNGLEVTGLPFKGLYGNDFRGGAGNVHGWEGNGGYGGGGAGRSTHDYRGSDGSTEGSRDVAGGNGGQGFVMVVYYGQGNLK